MLSWDGLVGSAGGAVSSCSEAISFARGDFAVVCDLVEIGDVAAGLGGSGMPDGEETVGLPALETVVSGVGVIGLVDTPLLKTSAKDLRGEAGLVEDGVTGLVSTPPLMTSEKGFCSSAKGAIGLVSTPVLTTSEKGLRSSTKGVIGLVSTPMLMTSERASGDAATGLVSTPLLITSENGLFSSTKAATGLV
jgi:hypothetical protein